VKALKGFSKLLLQPGETREVTITLEERAFAFYDVNTHAWTVEPGEFTVLAGASATDIRLQATLII
jgi:beta-glucosidase